MEVQSVSKKLVVSLNLEEKAWRAFQRFCEGNAVGYSHAAETALVNMMRRAQCWPPPRPEAQKEASPDAAVVVE
jgi:hypothetical protein